MLSNPQTSDNNFEKSFQQPITVSTESHTGIHNYIVGNILF